jgi:hypothetical protein
VARPLKGAGRLALASMVAVLAGACPPKRPKVTDIEVVPFKVVLGDPSPPLTFELEARLWTGPATDRRSIAESQGYDNLDWEVSETWLTVQPGTGFKAKFTVVSTPTTPAQVTVKAGGKTSQPTEVSVAPSAITNQDIVDAKYTPLLAPDAVVANGSLDPAGEPCDVAVSPFVKRGGLGQLLKPCGKDPAGWAAVLSLNHRMSLNHPVLWTAPPLTNTVDATPLQNPMLTLPVAIRVMVWDDPPADLTKLRDEILKLAQTDIDKANPVLAEARAGISLAHSLANSAIIPVNSQVVITDCRVGHDPNLASDVPDLLNVYYVDDVVGVNATTCGRREGRTQEVIYIGRNQWTPSTFVHELGHAMGLTVPRQGHTEYLQGFDLTNMMAGYDDDSDPLGRSRLSVGQVFRMNADSASWLNWAVVAPGSTAPVRDGLRLRCQCGEDGEIGPCPRLRDDVARPSARPAVPGDWHCTDRLLLKKLPEIQADAESPVAILAGRRWRAPPAKCSDRDIAGRLDKHSSATFIKFENLTRAGTCPSWAAVFLRQHGLLYLKLEEPTFMLTQIADELQVWDNLLPLIDVTVDVTYPANHKTTVVQDTQHAGVTLGELNRTGILLHFVEHPVTNNPIPACPAAAPRAIQICYAEGGTDEGVLLSPGRARIWLGARTGTTASHFLGQALGLDRLTATDLTSHGEEFADNIMQPDPAKRRQRLTLGQVYRINVPIISDLNQPPQTQIPACSGPAVGCPSLWADVTQ